MTDLALPLTLSTEQKRRLYDSAANHFFRELDGVKENTRSTSIERFYRFENAQFLENAGEWVRCLAHITPRKARLQLVYLFMGAFLWEGETINYAPCEAFLNLWERTRIHRIETERPRFGELLKEFNRIFPREIEREGKANALFQTRWERIEELTSLIEARLESDGKNDSEKLSEEEETRFTGSIAMLLGYRAMAHHFLGRSASPIYRRVCRQLRGIEDIAWAESYVRVELAYHELERGRLPEALAAIRTAYEYRDNEYVDGDYTDREIDARISQALGDVFWTLERLPEAFECWCLAIHESLFFSGWSPLC